MPRRARRGCESLTPAEAKIAALVAQGMTNRQIADRLFLSHWTVSTHVSHILGKLDVRSRIDIARETTNRVGGLVGEALARQTFEAARETFESAARETFESATRRDDLMPVVDGLIEPGQKERSVAPDARSREKAPVRQPTLSGCRLSAVAAWLLPAGERARYGEEYRSELHDLAAAGAGRRQQLGYAVRLLVRAAPLRVAVLAPRHGKASP
jgi:DNA-binding CsgD family transcriptional regulator